MNEYLVGAIIGAGTALTLMGVVTKIKKSNKEVDVPWFINQDTVNEVELTA